MGYLGGFLLGYLEVILVVVDTRRDSILNGVHEGDSSRNGYWCDSFPNGVYGVALVMVTWDELF